MRMIKRHEISISDHYESIRNIRNELCKKVGLDLITECDGCGCLLLKSAKFKQPSTIEFVEESNPYHGRSGCPPSDYAVYVGGKREVIKEHYKCFRCAPENTKAKE